jgi:hypothetical protein
MRNDDHSWRNQRLIDIFCVIAVLGIMWSGFYLLTENRSAPLKTSFIVPSQSVHW